MQLLQLPMFSQQKMMKKIGKKARAWAFDFGFWYAFHLSVLSVCMVFAVDLPLIPSLGCIFFTAKYWVDKYNFSFRVWRISGESGGAIASSVVSFVFFFQSFYLFIMAGYFVTVGIKADDSQSKKEVLGIPIPSKPNPKGLAIGGLALLVCSIILFFITVGERAQKSIVTRYAGKIRSFFRSVSIAIARRLADWGVTTPTRGIYYSDDPTVLSSVDRHYLQNAYTHPYEKTFPNMPSLHSEL